MSLLCCESNLVSHSRCTAATFAGRVGKRVEGRLAWQTEAAFGRPCGTRSSSDTAAAVNASPCTCSACRGGRSCCSCPPSLALPQHGSSSGTTHSIYPPGSLCHPTAPSHGCRLAAQCVLRLSVSGRAAAERASAVLHLLPQSAMLTSRPSSGQEAPGRRVEFSPVFRCCHSSSQLLTGRRLTPAFHVRSLHGAAAGAAAAAPSLGGHGGDGAIHTWAHR